MHFASILSWWKTSILVLNNFLFKLRVVVLLLLPRIIFYCMSSLITVRLLSCFVCDRVSSATMCCLVTMPSVTMCCLRPSVACDHVPIMTICRLWLFVVCDHVSYVVKRRVLVHSLLHLFSCHAVVSCYASFDAACCLLRTIL